MSDNWIVQNLENALKTWNDKLSEIWQLITQSPEQFKGGSIWNVIVDIHGAVQAIGLALLVLFFVIGVMKTCGSFAEVKKPEHALKLFIRFALAKGVVTYVPIFDDITEFVIPEAMWVVFENDGLFKEDVQSVFHRFLTEFLPFSGYEYAGLPDIEIYPISEGRPTKGHSEVWIAIKKTKES